MMSPEFNDEWLSAWFDGELAPHEREAVERRLQLDADLRSRLDDYAELRRLFCELPLPPPPADLQHRVLQRVAESAIVLRRQPQSPPKTDRGRWRLHQTVAVVLVFVCVGGMGVWILTAPRAGLRPAALDLLPEGGLADRAERRFARETLSSERLVGAIEARELPTGTAQDARFFAAPGIVDVDQLRQRLLAPGQTPTPGEKLSYLDSIDEMPVVVTYSVVDVLDAFDDVQVLLEREGIHSLDGSVRSSVSPRLNQAHAAVAIYLEAAPAQVDAILKQLPVAFESPAVDGVALPPSTPGRQEGAANSLRSDSRARTDTDSAKQAPSQTSGLPAANAEKPAATVAKIKPDEPAFQFVVPFDRSAQLQWRGLPDAHRQALQAQQLPHQIADAELNRSQTAQQSPPTRTPATAGERDADANSGKPQANAPAQPPAEPPALRRTSDRMSVILILQGAK